MKRKSLRKPGKAGRGVLRYLLNPALEFAYVALVSVLCALSLDAQSVSITQPATNAALTGWNNTFTVSYAGTDIAEVCYTVDSYLLYNPGIDAPTSVGCSTAPPFAVQFNSFWYLNGPHQVVASAYNSLGTPWNGVAPVATSAAVPFTTANPCPILDTSVAGVGCTNGAFNVSMTVSTGTPLSSNWSGGVTVTPTLTGALIGTDSLTFSFYIDGILQQTITNSTSTATATLYTTPFPNGPHNVALTVLDNTTETQYTGVGGNTGFLAEWSRQVTLANGTTASQALVNYHEVYCKPGDTVTLAAQILNTDGTTSTPSSLVVFAPARLYVNGTTTTAPANLAPPYSSIATINSSGAISCVGNGTALFNVMTPTVTYTDLQINGLQPEEISSAAHPLTSAQTGWVLNVTGGTAGQGWIPGVYQVSSVQNGVAILGNNLLGYDLSSSVTNAAGGQASGGPTRQVWVHVWSDNIYPSYGSDGSIQTTYNASKSMYVNSIFNGLEILQGDAPYNSRAGTGNCTTGLPCGVSFDFGISGYNTFEFGSLPGNLSPTGTGSATSWTSILPPFIASTQTNGLSLNPKFRGLVIGNALLVPQALWALTYGAESNPNFITSPTSMTAWQYAVSQYAAQGNILGISGIDEISGTWASNPLQGPIVFSNSGTRQSGLTSIVASAGICATTVSASSPPISFVNDGQGMFVIHGSVTAGMNSVPAAATATASGSTVTVAMTNQGSGYSAGIFGPWNGAVTCALSGGGGTYTSCTPTVSNGSVTGITVSGASGYTGNPTVAIGYQTVLGGNTLTTGGPVYPVAFPTGAIGKVSVSGGVVTVAMTGSGTNQGSNYYVAPICTLTGGGGTYTGCSTTVDGSGHVNAVTITGSTGYIFNPILTIASSSNVTTGMLAGWTFSCPGVANGTYNVSNDSGLTVEAFADGWYTNGLSGGANPDYGHYDMFAKLITQLNASPNANNFVMQYPPNGGEAPFTFANWGGNPSYSSSQSIGSITSIATSSDVYWPNGILPYLNSRLPAINLNAFGNPGYQYRSLYGAIDPDRPFVGLTETTGAYFGLTGYPASVTSCSGNTITFSGPHGIANVVPGLTRLWITGATDGSGATDTCNNNFTVLAAPTPTTITVLLGATNFTAVGTSVASGGGTAHFAGAVSPAPATLSLAGLNAVGTPSHAPTPNGNLGGDVLNLSTAWSQNNQRLRGQQFTISGFTGTSTPTASCLISGNCTPNAGTFVLLPENLNPSLAPSGGVSISGNSVNYSQMLMYREAPVLNATGGTARILPDFNYRKGISGSINGLDLNAPWALGSFWEGLHARSSGTRTYKLGYAPNGYSDQLGFTAFSFQNNLAQFATTAVAYQSTANEHFEDNFAVPTFWAVSNGMLEAVRDAKYFLTPARNSPDCGPYIDCAVRCGAAGCVFFALNITDGVQSFKTPSLAPYETSGQSFIRKVVNATGIGPITVLSAGTATDTLTLQPLDAVVYTFPVTFAGELQQPTLAVRMADVANASDLVIHWSYDPYHLQVDPNVYDCGGSGLCTLPADLNFRPSLSGPAIYLQYLFRDSSGDILSCKNGICPVSTF